MVECAFTVFLAALALAVEGWCGCVPSFHAILGLEVSALTVELVVSTLIGSAEGTFVAGLMGTVLRASGEA